MEKITLQPGVWTQVFTAQLVQSRSNQTGLRIHYLIEETVPAADTDLYFVTQEFDLKPLTLFESPGVKVYLMPDDDIAIDVVML